jgi:hypothetical protein
MHKWLLTWTADKITALVLLIGCLILVFTGIDGEVKSILTLAAGWLFGSAFTEKKQEKKS